jgi:hypothetical protein
LPPTYENFVIILDATPDEQLMLDLVITHLLNEESRQLMANGAESHDDTALYAKGKVMK